MILMNMFSIFDPSTSPMMSLNWLSMGILLFLLPYPFWVYHNRFFTLWSLLTHALYKEFKVIIPFSYSNLIIFISLLMTILFNNFMGLFPYIFTASSHMNFCLSMSLTLWLSMMMFSMLNYFNDLCSHLTPQGTPSILMPFMVLIESISLIIRPFTLAIRLTANMIAGHMLLSLLGGSGKALPLMLLPLLIIAQILLYTLEMAVAIIQSYVYAILTTLYSSEV